MTAFWEAIQRPGGAVGRGPRRWYVEVHPASHSRLRRSRHPSLGRPRCARRCSAPNTRSSRSVSTRPSRARRTSPGIATFPRQPTPGGIAASPRSPSISPASTSLRTWVRSRSPPGTQWDDGRAWKHEMFPRAGALAALRGAGDCENIREMGDISCRSALTMHRGTDACLADRPAGARARRRCAGRRATPRCTT